MIEQSALKEIAEMFCGDLPGGYPYKKGDKLVDFFNTNFNAGVLYQSGFPSRWDFVKQQLEILIETKRINSFFDIILSADYISKEFGISRVEAVNKSVEILTEFNKVLLTSNYRISKVETHYLLINIHEDEEKIGEGGFANVYLQKSTGLVVKRLKEEYLSDEKIARRFKREYEITKELGGIPDLSIYIIKVYSFDEDDYSYTMEKAEHTLEEFYKKEIGEVLETERKKISLSCYLLNIFAKLHNLDHIHRDISPNNIFMINKNAKIADFVLGKNLKAIGSFNTTFTNNFGQYDYCAPEQREGLKKADKRSDVYSLGRLVNFIMTGSPIKYNHDLQTYTRKATEDDPDNRYQDAGQFYEVLYNYFERYKRGIDKTETENKIKRLVLDEDTQKYILDLSDEKLSICILQGKPENIDKLLVIYMKKDKQQAYRMITAINKTYKDICKGFGDYDNFAYFANKVIREKGLSYETKEIAAYIINYIAYSVNRFNAQGIVDDLIRSGIEPMLEDIIKR